MKHPSYPERWLKIDTIHPDPFMASVEAIDEITKALVRKTAAAMIASERIATKPKGKAGRRPEYDSTADAKLANDWDAAMRSGAYKAEFAHQRGMTLTDFERLLARVARARGRAKQSGANKRVKRV